MLDLGHNKLTWVRVGTESCVKACGQGENTRMEPVYKARLREV